MASRSSRRITQFVVAEAVDRQPQADQTIHAEKFAGLENGRHGTLAAFAGHGDSPSSRF
jgi:hypothetical protein